MFRLTAVLVCLFTVFLGPMAAQESSASTTGDARIQYKLLATNKTSTMEHELNEAAQDGYRFQGVMGGETGFGGREVVIVMGRAAASIDRERYQYMLLATQKTSTMQKELQQAGDRGFEYKGQTVFETAFGGKEVVVILERDNDRPLQKWDYKLLATQKTSTMQKELSQAGQNGFQMVGVTVGKSAFGGNEVVSILRRPRNGARTMAGN
ncbi:MAG: hypothetical protein L0Z53_02305 [Acidobacteriales bacterium]|nr:hypothetical protein [Terriglobales bacterium]